MKNLRQLLRRPVRNCEAELWSEEHPDGRYTVGVRCNHLKTARIVTLVGSGRLVPEHRDELWRCVKKDLETHRLCSDPW